MSPKVREALDQIDKVLAVGDADARALWSVLSALRGPDSKDYALKSATTSVIRYTAFPLAAKHADKHGGPLYASMIPDSKVAVAARVVLNRYNGDHFAGHSNDAFRALELRWDLVNEENNDVNA